MATMKRLMLGAIALALLGLLLTWLWDVFLLEPSVAVPVATAQAAVLASAPETLKPSVPSTSPELPPERVAAQDPALCTLRIRTRERGSDRPVAGSRVATSRGDGRTALAYWPAGSTDAKGELILTDLAPGWLSIRAADGKDETWTTLLPGGTSDADVLVEPLAEIIGKVVTPTGDPVAAAELWISDANVEHEGEVIALTQADGTFRLPLRGTERVVVARASGIGVSDAVPLNCPRAFDEELVIKLAHGAARVVGTVVGDDGRPVAGARVVIGSFNPSRRAAITSGPYGHNQTANAVVPTTTSADGTFGAETVPCISSTALFVRSPGWTPQYRALDVRAGQTTRVDIRLERGFQVRGVVTTPDGRPAANVLVDAKATRRADMSTPPDWVSLITITAADGTFLLPDLEPGSRNLGADSKSLGRANVQLDGTSGASLTWNPVLDAGRTITCHLTDEEGRALSGWRVDAEAKRQRVLRTTDTAGHVAFVRCTEDKYSLVVYQKDAWMPTRVLAIHDVVADGPAVELRVPSRAISTSRVSGTVFDSRGLPVASVISVRVDNSEGSQQMSMALPPGPFEVAPIRAGTFTIGITVAGCENLTIPRFDLAPGGAHDLGKLSATRLPK